MKIIYFILFYFYISIGHAGDWGKYEYQKFTPLPENVFNSLNSELAENQFEGIYLNNRMIHSASGFNQIYFDTFLKTAIYIKYDIGGNVVHDQILSSGKNSLYHFKDNLNKSYALTFVNLRKEKIEDLVNKIKFAITNAQYVQYKRKFLNIFKARAYANTELSRSIEYTKCIDKSQLEIIDTKSIENIGSHAAVSVLLNCFSEIGNGAKGAATDLYNLGKTIYSSVANISLSKIVDVTKSFASGVVMIAQAMNGNFAPLLQRLAGPFQEVFMAIKEGIKNLTPKQALSFFCNMLGTLGFDVLLGMLTGGAIHIINPLGIVNKVKRLTHKFFAMLGKEPPSFYRNKEFVFDPNSTPEGFGVVKEEFLPLQKDKPTHDFLSNEPSLYKVDWDLNSARRQYLGIAANFSKEKEKIKKHLVEDLKLIEGSNEYDNKFDQLVQEIYRAKYLSVNNNFVQKVQAEYFARGIPVRTKVNDNGEYSLLLDVKNIKNGSKFSKFIRRFKRIYPELKLDDVMIYNPAEEIKIGARGYFDSITGEIDIGLGVLEGLDSDMLDTTFLHELRHAAFQAQRNRGIESPFDLLYVANNNKVIDDSLQSYNKAFYAEEIYNHSKMLRDYRKLINTHLANGDDLIVKKVITKVLAPMIQRVKELSTAVVRRGLEVDKNLDIMKTSIYLARESSLERKRDLLAVYEKEFISVKEKRITVKANDSDIMMKAPIVNKEILKRLENYSKLDEDSKLGLISEIIEETQLKQSELIRISQNQINYANDFDKLVMEKDKITHIVDGKKELIPEYSEILNNMALFRAYNTDLNTAD